MPGEQVDRQAGGEGAVLVVDASGLPRKGELSVGVARPSCGEVGKGATCQVRVTLSLARREVPLPVGLRRFLPPAWTKDPGRCEAAGVPEAARTVQSKPAIARAEIDQVRAAGLAFACVLADAGFARSPVFRHRLTAHERVWAERPQGPPASQVAWWRRRRASPAPSGSIRPRSGCVRRPRRAGERPNTRSPTERHARQAGCWTSSAASHHLT